jgi:hypothetical protein
MKTHIIKQITTCLLCCNIVAALTSCSDYLETDSPSKTDAAFVFSTSETARAALEGAYANWADAAQNKVFGDGLFYAADVAGSDIERHPEGFSAQPGRHYPECFYQNGKYASEYALLSYQKESDTYASLYAIVNKANIVVQAIQTADGFEEMLAAGTESTMGQLYGEAVALKATAYRELLKYFGDVPYLSGKATDSGKLCGRDSIYDVILDELQKAAPVMYRLGSIPGITGKNYFSRTYVEGLIGRIALEAGGYQTRRGDLSPRTDGNGNTLTFETMGRENNGATYGRRSDYRNYYELAQKYFKAVIDNPGTAVFHATDPRSAESGRTYGNPYQYFFQQMHEDDNGFADESIYEVSIAQGAGNDARPYSFGRPATGGSKNNYPCKNYGQGRINPAFYYGVFDPADMRRDVSCTVTASNGGNGTEILLPFNPGSQGKGGGISLNKWDENRQTKVWTANQRKSGINGPYMRLSEIYLGYAEACAVLGNDAEAKKYLTIIRERAFPVGKANVDQFIAAEGSLIEAVIDERGFEFAGEGDRRTVLIRTGLIGKKIKAIKELTTKMMNGLEADGYYRFDNGNVISAKIYTKMVDAKAEKGHRLTAQCPAGGEDDPILFPGWRGVNDDWASYGLDYKGNTLTNLAIQGLFKPVTAEEAAALEADGYAAVDWGATLLSNRDEYEKYLFYEYDYESAPIHYWPFTPNILSNGGFTNGYGFKQE